jgi:hypothetical protein
MRLPFLPLRPTGGTNDAEAGGSGNPPRLTPAADDVVEEALGMPELEIVRNILEQIHAGDEEGAKEQACDTAVNWLSVNGLHKRLRDEDVVWAALMRNVFPNAPHPTHHAPHLPEPRLPVTNKEWFYAMCNRYRLLRELRERYKSDLERLKMMEEEVAGSELTLFVHGQESASKTPEWYTKSCSEECQRLRRRIWKLKQQKAPMLDELADAEDLLTIWAPVPRPLRPRRQSAWVPSDSSDNQGPF